MIAGRYNVCVDCLMRLLIVIAQCKGTRRVVVCEQIYLRMKFYLVSNCDQIRSKAIYDRWQATHLPIKFNPIKIQFSLASSFQSPLIFKIIANFAEIRHSWKVQYRTFETMPEFNEIYSSRRERKHTTNVFILHQLRPRKQHILELKGEFMIQIHAIFERRDATAKAH